MTTELYDTVARTQEQLTAFQLVRSVVHRSDRVHHSCQFTLTRCAEGIPISYVREPRCHDVRKCHVCQSSAHAIPHCEYYRYRDRYRHRYRWYGMNSVHETTDDSEVY